MHEECQDLGGGFDSPRPQFGMSASASAAGMAIPTAMSFSTPRVTGGSTISGQRYVTNINTQTTNDRFVPLDSFSVTIQLIHVEGKRYQAKLMNNYTNELLPNVDYLTEQRRRQQEEQLAAQRALLVPTVPQSTVLPNTLSNTQPPVNWNHTSTGFSLFD
jgi:sensor histidine kinase YesM